MAPYAMDIAFENAHDRPREIEIGRPTRTEQLAKWITNVRHKKLKCNCSPKRNFRMEAVLTHALHQAEYELRAKQLSRLSRWLRLRKQLLKGVDYGACGAYNMAEEELEKSKDLDARQISPFEMADSHGEKERDKERERIAVTQVQARILRAIPMRALLFVV